MAPTPRILYVTMQPHPTLPTAQFHDWYNNEHSPLRLCLPFVQNGFRYRATDLQGAGPSKEVAEWMAIYDVADMADLTKEIYTRLRKDPMQSQRERDTMKQITVDRKFFDLVESREATEFKCLEDVNAETETQGNVLVAVCLTVYPGKEKELEKWYATEHIPLLSKAPGGLRTRRFVTSSIEGKGRMEHLALHEYSPKNRLCEKEYMTAASTPWEKEVLASVVRVKRRRTYDLYLLTFDSTDGQTRTFPISMGQGAAVESYVTTKDSVLLPYRLEGSTNPNALLIVLSNSILVSWGIWDRFLAAFFSSTENKKNRILRYHTRGRSSNCGDSAVTLDVLAADIITLLDALRVPRAAALIGVSLGGATVLNTALKYPERVARFVAYDTSAKSPDGNKRAWGERIVIAEKEGAVSQTGETRVGGQLAELTVRRWFAEESYDGRKLEAEIAKVKTMVAKNNLAGFKKSVEALFNYDVRSEMKNSNVKGAFQVGGSDGVLPGVMEEMAKGLGNHGAEYMLVEGAGHLPMVEKPVEVAENVGWFLIG